MPGVNLILGLVFIAALSGCGDIYLDALRGTRITLMPEKAPAKVRVEQVVWFKYWGNEPFSEPETHAATIINDKHLQEARIRMVNTVADGLISTFTGPSGFPRRTLIVEGNPVDEPAKFRTEYKNWYLLYGLLPVWTTQPEEIIQEQNLVEVRAQTRDTVADAVITTLSAFLPILIFPQHVTVEGNRKSDLPAQSLPAESSTHPITRPRAIQRLPSHNPNSAIEKCFRISRDPTNPSGFRPTRKQEPP